MCNFFCKWSDGQCDCARVFKCQAVRLIDHFSFKNEQKFMHHKAKTKTKKHP